MNRLVRRLAKALKRLMPQAVFDVIDPLGHGLEAWTAALVNGFPGHSLRVIGITGTNGKTSTAVLTAKVFEEAGYVVGLSTTALYQVGPERFANDRNSTVTNPWDLQRLLARMRRAGVQIVVLEVTSHALAQNRVAGIRFEGVALTNITQDHLNYHRTMDRYVAAKAKLFQKPHLVLSVLNADDPAGLAFQSYPAKRHLMYQLDKPSNIYATNLHMQGNGTTFTLNYDRASVEVSLQLPGAYNVANALAAAGLALGLDLSLDKVGVGLSALTAVPGRMERIEAGQAFTVIVDYAHTPDALANLYGAIRTATTGRILAILGAAGDRDRTTRPMMGQIVAEHADLVVLTDDEPYSEKPAAIRSQIEQGLLKGGARKGQTYEEIPDRRAAIRHLFGLAKAGDTVVLTGMGHQQYRITAGVRQPWDERVVARELLAELQGR
jgi:UDP-N-acetylmuramoyl-L-alanyl-D-glutamate--2,6-diaminopimelate ligase